MSTVHLAEDEFLEIRFEDGSTITVSLRSEDYNGPDPPMVSVPINKKMLIKMIQVRGLNHLTLRVSNLEQALALFCGLLGFSIQHRGTRDAYLECGSLWLALVERRVGETSDQTAGLDHVALTVNEPDFDAAVAELRASAVEIVNGPLLRGTGRSVYFLGPDKIIIELHTSSLKERMTVWT